jgi:polyribonucleotide nucleotidyltransferase
MDIKVDGLSYEVLAKALAQAKEGRLHILEKITDTMAEPREDYKPHTPRIVQIRIPKEFIGAVIGTGGKVIQEIQAVTGTTIVIEEEGNEGIVDIFAENLDSIEKALNWVKSIIELPEVGKVYQGKVKSIVAFGAFVEILPGKEGLLHISEVDWKRLEDLDGVLKEGDEVEVILLEIDQKTGKLRLSRKALMEKPEGYVERPERPPRDRGGDRRGGDRGDRRDDRRRGGIDRRDDRRDRRR